MVVANQKQSVSKKLTTSWSKKLPGMRLFLCPACFAMNQYRIIIKQVQFINVNQVSFVVFVEILANNSKFN
jgi:hypothetical protein